MRRPAVPALAALVAVLLVAGVVRAVTAGGRSPLAPVATTTSSPQVSSSTTTAAPATTVEAVVPAIEAFVAATRGLAYKQPVAVTLLGDDAFEARVTEVDQADRQEVEHAQAVLQAMGLLGHDVDLAAAVRAFTAGAVLGFYDTDTKELVVRGTRPTPFVRVVLAHELTHALDDQWFGLDRDDRLDDEGVLGFQALTEGSADRVESRYRRSLTPAERRQADREEAAVAGAVPAVPEVVQVVFGFPYAFGPDLVDAVVRAGGQRRLDEAFAHPPASTEQVLDPSKYLAGTDAPRAVPVPAAEGAAFDDGQIGQLSLLLMLLQGLGDGEARRAAEGWGGDRYVAWSDGGRTCVRMDFVMDTPRDTAELVTALDRWAASRAGAAVASGTSLRTCG